MKIIAISALIALSVSYLGGKLTTVPDYPQPPVKSSTLMRACPGKFTFSDHAVYDSYPVRCYSI